MNPRYLKPLRFWSSYLLDTTLAFKKIDAHGCRLNKLVSVSTREEARKKLERQPSCSLLCSLSFHSHSHNRREMLHKSFIANNMFSASSKV